NSEFLEPGMFRFDIEVLCGRKPILGDAEPRRPVPENHQPLRVAIGKRTQKHRIGDAKYRRVYANADRDGNQSDGGKAGIFLECAKAEFQIVEDHGITLSKWQRPS